MPLIRLTADVQSPPRRGVAGEVVDWPGRTCTALVDAGVAEWFTPEPESADEPAEEE